MKKVYSLLLLLTIILALPIISAQSLEREVYIIPYMGDIDGDVSDNWYFFYEMVADFHHNNKIPVSLSQYSGTLNLDPALVHGLEKMYDSPYIELMQKGFDGNDRELVMDSLSPEEQEDVISSGQDAFIDFFSLELERNNAQIPHSYTQLGGRVTQTTLNILEHLDIDFYFDVYYNDDLGPLDSSDSFDVMQYGVALTKNGGSGRNSIFRSKSEIYNDLNTYERQDLSILKIDNNPVLPLWTHQQDFESSSVENSLDNTKWNFYKNLLQDLNDDPKVHLITPSEMYDLRHDSQPPEEEPPPKDEPPPQNETDPPEEEPPIEDPSTSGEEICQFASSSSTETTNSDTPPSLALGAPDASETSCTEWKSYGTSWAPPNWDIDATLSLKFDTPVTPTELTIFGYYDMCWSHIILKNSETNEQLQIFEGFEESCIASFEITENFLADTVILETCGWSWSYTDAVELCGTTE